MYKFLFGRGIRIGIFAPQKEQAKTDYDRLKQLFQDLQAHGVKIEFKERNATTLRPELPDIKNEKGEIPMANISFTSGNEVYIFPLSKTSHPESKTLDLIIIEEAQNVDEFALLNYVFPMGAATNASKIFVGTAGYQICYFQKLLIRERTKKFIYDCHKVIEDRQKMYERTKDEFHLNYASYIRREQERGEDTDEFKTQYLLQWVLGTGQFITEENFNRMVSEHQRVYHDNTSNCYGGIDTAKDPDSTVVTILRWNATKKRKELCNWLKLHGDNYKNQFDIIIEFFKHYNIKGVAIDSTGQGDFMPDLFEAETRWRDENSGLYRVKFSAVSKDILYKNLGVVCREFLTTLPIIATKEAEEFKQQMLDLQKEYKGELLSCHHPDSKDAHDDYCDSWALAEYCYTKEQERGEPNIRILDSNEIKKEDTIKRDDKGNITDDWIREELWE